MSKIEEAVKVNVEALEDKEVYDKMENPIIIDADNYNITEKGTENLGDPASRSKVVDEGSKNHNVETISELKERARLWPANSTNHDMLSSCAE
jgi:hypothetical protein